MDVRKSTLCTFDKKYLNIHGIDFVSTTVHTIVQSVCWEQPLNSNFFFLFKGAVVGVSKHLCGAATDLTLRCLETFSASGNAKGKIETILIALCCHHRCDWNIYVGKDRIF